MTDQEPTYAQYLWEAFNLRLPIPGLGGLPLNWLMLLVFAVASLALPPLVFIGIALELAYLAFVSNNQAFQDAVKRKRKIEALSKGEQSFREQMEQRVAALSDASRLRYEQLLVRADRMRDEGPKDLVGDVAQDGIERLQAIFLRLLGSREVLQRQIQRSARDRLVRELDDSRAKLEALSPEADDRIRRSLSSTVEILERRVGNLDTALENLDFIDSELRRIEHQAELIVEEATLAKDPKALSTRIDAVTATFDETQEWMRMNRELFDELGDDDDDPRPPINRLKAAP